MTDQYVPAPATSARPRSLCAAALATSASAVTAILAAALLRSDLPEPGA